MRNKNRTVITTEYSFTENQIENAEEEAVVKQKPIWKRFAHLGAYLVLVTTIFCFARPACAPTASMAPTIPTPCICLMAPIYGMFNLEPQRFDVVSIKMNEAQGEQLNMPTYKQLCKRVIGLGGEKLEIKDGLVYINDELLQEDFLPDDYIPNGNFGPYYIPEGHVFLMGDNRNYSFDSRYLSDPYFSYESITALTWFCIGRETHFIR